MYGKWISSIQDSLIVFPKTMYQTVTNDNIIILKEEVFVG